MFVILFKNWYQFRICVIIYLLHYIFSIRLLFSKKFVLPYKDIIFIHGNGFVVLYFFIT